MQRLISFFLLMVLAAAGFAVQVPVNPAPISTSSVGGDLTGTIGAATVSSINGVALGSTTATSGNLLIGSGSQWVTNVLSGAGSLTSGGVLSLTGGDTTRHQIGLGTADSPTFSNLTDSALTSGRVTYAGAAGILSNDANFTRSATVLTVDSAVDGTYTLGNCEMGLIGSGVSGRTYYGQTGAFTTAGGYMAISAAGATDVNSASGSVARLLVAGTTCFQVSSIQCTALSGHPIASQDTTDATSASTGSVKVSGGSSAAKNTITGQGFHAGVAITATAAATTTLTSTSTGLQIFTGATTQTVQLPAANLFGAGISVHYTLVNRSTGSVSWQRAGTDLINGASSNVAVTTLTAGDIYSDGATNWYTR